MIQNLTIGLVETTFGFVTLSNHMRQVVQFWLDDRIASSGWFLSCPLMKIIASTISVCMQALLMGTEGSPRSMKCICRVAFIELFLRLIMRATVPVPSLSNPNKARLASNRLNYQMSW